MDQITHRQVSTCMIKESAAKIIYRLCCVGGMDTMYHIQDYLTPIKQESKNFQNRPHALLPGEPTCIRYYRNVSRMLKPSSGLWCAWALTRDIAKLHTFVWKLYYTLIP